MELKLKISSEQCRTLESLVNSLFLWLTEKDYITFYNVSTFIKKVRDRNLKNHFTQKKSITVSLNPNEYDTIMELFESAKVTCQYQQALITDFSAQLNKQYFNLQYKMNQAYITEPKNLNENDRHRLA